MVKHTCLALLVAVLRISEGVPQAITQSPLCKQRNGYFPMDGSCDSYLECRDFVANEMLCPDGLHYNPEAQWPAYPCGYPMDVPCQGRGVPQPAIPTANCPHQYGFYPSPLAVSGDCGQYRMCVEGRAIEMVCPPGLAFNPTSARCDWPDLVPDCDVESFLGFRCPAIPEGQTLNFRYEADCAAFFSCSENGRARLLTCEPGFAFDQAAGFCIDADKASCQL